MKSFWSLVRRRQTSLFMLLHVLFKTRSAVPMSQTASSITFTSAVVRFYSKKSWSLFFFMLTNSIQHNKLWWRRSRASDGAPCRAGGSWRHRSPPPPASVASAAQRRAGTRISTTWHKHCPRRGLEFSCGSDRLSDAKWNEDEEGFDWLPVGDHFHQRLKFFDRTPDPLNWWIGDNLNVRKRNERVSVQSDKAGGHKEQPEKPQNSSRTWINSALTYFTTLLDSTCDSAFSEFPHQHSEDSICQKRLFSTSNVSWPLL